MTLASLRNSGCVRYLLAMAPFSVRPFRPKGVTVCGVAFALLLFAVGLPVGDLCCVASNPCCPHASQASAPLEMRAPILDCCRSIVNNEMATPKVRLPAGSDASQPMAEAVTSALRDHLPSRGVLPELTAEPGAGPTPPPRATRAPPLS